MSNFLVELLCEIGVGNTVNFVQILTIISALHDVLHLAGRGSPFKEIGRSDRWDEFNTRRISQKRACCFLVQER
jgi:hypothetical protein